jgi:GGDEF domain-containing protein
VGYSLAPRDGSDATALLKVADEAMYTGRRARRARS